jgi:hypothetical protein
MLVCDRYRFHKNSVRTHYTKFVCLHPVGYACTYCILVHLRRKTSMHYFSYLGGTDIGLTKSASGHNMRNSFLHPLGSVSRVVHSGASWSRNIDTQFFMLRWDQYGSHKKRAGTRYVEDVFLHLAAYAAHVVHSGVSRPRSVDALFFTVEWDR